MLIYLSGPRGGMVDTADSKSAAVTGVLVQVRSGVPTEQTKCFLFIDFNHVIFSLFWSLSSLLSLSCPAPIAYTHRSSTKTLFLLAKF